MTESQDVHPPNSPKPDSRFFDGITWTPEIETAAELVAQWVTNDMCGAALWGLPRVGKSEFAKYLEKIADDLFDGETLIIRLRFEGETYTNRVKLLKRIAKRIDVRATGSDEMDIRNRIMDEIFHRCTPTTHWILVIVDEVQNIKQDLYGEFSMMEAEIGDKGYRSFFLSIGQPELQSTVKGLENNLAITGRQYQNIREFRGLTFDRIEQLLEDLEGEDLMFTRKHLPWRAERGWSITSLIEPIKQAVLSVIDLDGMNRELFFPMSYLRQTLANSFHYLQEPDNRDAELTAEVVLEAFTLNGFKKLLHLYVKPKEKPKG
jgi:hypothetical protein